MSGNLPKRTWPCKMWGPNWVMSTPTLSKKNMAIVSPPIATVGVSTFEPDWVGEPDGFASICNS